MFAKIKRVSQTYTDCHLDANFRSIVFEKQFCVLFFTFSTSKVFSSNLLELHAHIGQNLVRLGNVFV